MTRSPSTSPFLRLSFQLLLAIGATGTMTPQGLTQLTASSCICPGRQLVYECTVVGQAIQYTVWRGSALNCGSGISLRHGLFIDTGYANNTCNDGAIFARIVSNTGGRYTSQLTINASLSFNGESIQCYFDDGSRETLINTDTISGITSAPFPPPNDVRLVDIQPGEITFNWTSVDAQCDSLSYNITSFNCGDCPPTTSSTNVTCTNVVALGQVCTFLIQTVICGNIGIPSHPTTVMLKAPRAQIIQSVPRYDYTTGSLFSIATSFDALESLTISDGFQNDILSYSVSYLDSSTTNICSQTVTIPVSACQNGLCKHLFHVSTSLCNSMRNITVIVTATSLLGSGSSDPIMIDSRNQFFDVDVVFNTNILRISCSFLNPIQAKGKRSCRVLFGLEQQGRCEESALRNEHTVRANQSYVSVDLPISVFPTKSVSKTICFVVIASDDDAHTTEAKGMLMVTAGCDANQLSDGTEYSGANCDSPLFTASIRNGLVCYTGTDIGATATHHCFNCGSSFSTVRTCLPNGTWNGTVTQCNCESTHTITSGVVQTAIPMAVVIILITSALIIVTVLLVRSRIQVQKLLTERKAKEKMQIYEDIDLSQIIDSMKNVAYEAPSQTQVHRSHS